ncbi:MAG: TraX family protein [Eubacterium sp.]
MSLSELNEYGVGKIIHLEKYGLSSFALKVIAVVTMFMDHFAILFFRNNEMLYNIFRGIGRLSFPLFCFVLVEGFFYTKNRFSYAIRLGVFALISEIPYNMFGGSYFDLQRQNVIFTLFFGFLTIWALDFISMFRVKYPENLLRRIGATRLNTLLELAAMIAGLAAAYFLKTSYSYAGVMLIICFYVFKKHHIGRLVSNMVFNMGMFGFSLQWLGTLSAIPIALYNGKPGVRRGKYFFYWFYPLHLTALVFLRILYLRIT